MIQLNADIRKSNADGRRLHADVIASEAKQSQPGDCFVGINVVAGLLAMTVVMFFLLSSLVWAQEEKAPIICNGDKVEFLEAEQKLIAEGHAQVFYQDVQITCDRIEMSLDTKIGHAQGNVVVYQKDSILTGDQVEYNFDTQSGTVYKAGFASQLIYGKAPQAIKEGPKEVTMRKCYMTTCDLDQPHYRMHAKTAKIILDDKVVMHNVIIFIGDLPVLYLPYYSYSLKPDRVKVTVLPGKDKDWGFYVLTAWRYEFNQYLKGILRLDYREKRDFASGFENYYETDRFGKGFVKTYYMNERNLESKNLWQAPRITHERERYMIQQRHSWEIDEETDLKFEYWGISDTDILKDYFYHKEYEREQPSMESYLSIVRSKPEYTVSFLGKRRFNKVLSAVEYQPELKLDVPNIRVGGENSKLYWNSANSFANLSKKEAHPSNVDEDAVRFDTFNTISYASQLGFLHFTPYIAARETYYTKDKYGDRDWFRGAFYTGVSMDTKFYRIFDITTNKWGLNINNLRHVITPTIGYDYIHRPTVASEKLVSFDGVDSLSRLNRFTLSLENKLQTKRKVSEKEFEAVDLARLTISTNYDYRLPEGSTFSDVNFDFEFTPFMWLTLEFDTAYDHIQDRFKTFNFDIYAEKEDKWKCGFGYRYAHESHSEATVELSFNPTPLWKLGIYERFMFKGYPYSTKKIYDLRQQEYRIVRDLHCWTSEILYTVSRGEGESIYFVFRLKAFPEMPLEFGSTYHRPKPGSQNPVR